MMIDSKRKENTCPSVPCPMDGFQSNCPYLNTEKCPHYDARYDFGKIKKGEQK